ncbi:MAG: hypothetical protein WDN06_08670 [Asticcacaulis sp.]
MSFRLYESAWVYLEGLDEPVQVRRDPVNRAAFHVGSFPYDIDARPLSPGRATPHILSILSLEAVRAAGLHSHYGRDIDDEPRQGRP